VDDTSSRSSNPAGDEAEIRLLSQLAPQPFTVLLKHRPWVNPRSRGQFDLQLSGHTHKGQIFPFNVVVKRFYPYLSGLIPLGQGSLLYVNRGSGTWGPPVRFLAPPEVTLIEIVPQQEG
jgi:predicted MPP superfamily phosphohydrolase